MEFTPEQVDACRSRNETSQEKHLQKWQAISFREERDPEQNPGTEVPHLPGCGANTLNSGQSLSGKDFKKVFCILYTEYYKLPQINQLIPSLPLGSLIFHLPYKETSAHHHAATCQPPLPRPCLPLPDRTHTMQWNHDSTLQHCGASSACHMAILSNSLPHPAA